MSLDAATEPASLEHWLNEASLQIHIPNLDTTQTTTQQQILNTAQREFAFYGKPHNY